MDDQLSRRDLLALAGAGLATAAAASAFQSTKKLYAYVGSWTKGPFGTGGGGGIHVYTVNMTDGSLTLVSQTGADMDDLAAGNLCISPNGRFLYSTNETKDLNRKAGAGGGVLAFAINQQNGSLTHLNTQQSMGVNPAYIAIDATGSRVVAANHGDFYPIVRVVKKNGVPEIENIYDDATVPLFAVKPDGSLEPACDVAVFERTHGGNPFSQASAHAHSVSFDPSNRFLLACDVGADRLYVYRFEPSSRSLSDFKVYPTPSGRAPRHSAFHPRLPYLFVINEDVSSLSSFHFDSKNGEVRMIQTVSTLPADYSGPHNAPADIRVHPNGKFLYGSNRGHDSIAIFKIDERNGELASVDIVKTQGANPREFNFEPSGKFLFVGNLMSNQIVTFAVDPETGKMTPTGARAEVPKPACIKFVEI